MRRKMRNRNLSSKITYTGTNKTPTNIQFIQYNELSHTEKTISEIQDIVSQINDQTVSWIRVTGLNDPELIIRLVKKFGLNIMDAKDVLSVYQIITVEEYDKNVFIALPVQYYNNDQDVIEHVALILGENYVISFQESDNPLFDSIHAAIKENSLRINNKKADFLLASLLGVIISNYGECVNSLENNLEDLEDQLLDTKELRKNLIGDIQEKRREMIRLRKLLLPFKEQMAKLLRVDKSLICTEEISYFKDVYDQLLYALQSLESCREIMSSLIDLYLNNNDLKMNQIMKRLTAVATIFIPLTFLVGVWGMNFKFMPELYWQYGYYVAWGIMVLIGLVLVWYLKKKGWF
ncbi:MAG: magnesium/cobalt transporter CorA [Dysgonamonadaceae bacterium]|nr:magnesium/cobalt transporter CorA [Dysgonamonadaceae bacterium]